MLLQTKAPSPMKFQGMAWYRVLKSASYEKAIMSDQKDAEVAVRPPVRSSGQL